MRTREAAPASKQSAATVPLRTTEDSITADAERTILTAVRWIVTAAVTAAVIVFALYVAWALMWVIA